MSIKLKNLHVLVVEDLAPIRELITSVLKAQGIGTISYATDGQKGYEAFTRFHPDIVLTDWDMPVINGIELIKEIRSNPHSPEKTVPIIMMTGYGSPSKIAQARNIGSTEFLVKPFSALDFSKRVMNIIKNPRDFIITPTFSGPDRRRKLDIGSSINGTNLRINPTGFTKKIKANNLLQAKVGLGNLSEETLLKSQSIFDNNTIDFRPIAFKFMEQFKDGLDIVKDKGERNRRAIERLVNPVMQIKANARIFKFSLLGDLSSIMLNFLESLNELDSDALDIVEAHHKTLYLIIKDDMRGDGGYAGQSLETELDNACKRYMNSRIAMQKEALQEMIKSK